MNPKPGDIVRLCSKIRRSWQVAGFPPPSRGHALNYKIYLTNIHNAFLWIDIGIDDICLVISTRMDGNQPYSELLKTSGETGWMHSRNLEHVPTRCVE